MADESSSRIAPRPLETMYFTPLVELTSFSRTEWGLCAAVDQEMLRVDVFRDDIVRLKMSRGGRFDEAPTFAVCAELAGPAPDFTIEDDGEVVRVRTAQLILVIGRSPFVIDAYHSDGSPICETWRDRTFVLSRAGFAGIQRYAANSRKKKIISRSPGDWPRAVRRAAASLRCWVPWFAR